MIGVDTNVLLRHILQDDPVQSPAASAFFAGRTSDDPVYVGRVVLVEALWSLRRWHGSDRSALVKMVRLLMSSNEAILEDRVSIHRALRDAEEADADLVDAIIAHAAIDAGAVGAVTFDKRAQRLPGMLPVV